MNKEDFIKELEKINIYLNKEQKEMLEKYYNYLIDYNSHTNVTSITTGLYSSFTRIIPLTI